MSQADLTELARSLTQSETAPFAFCGIAVRRAGRASYHVGCAPGIVASEETLFRVASLSKIVVGRAFVAAGGHDHLLSDASELLGWPLRNPAFADMPVTWGQIASHAAGLTDSAGLVSAAEPLADWFAKKGSTVWSDVPPGSQFDYANIGYALLAAGIESFCNMRFDLAARQLVLSPGGIVGGFNWSGVSPPLRAAALPTYRRDGQVFVPQIDGRRGAAGVLDPGGRAVDLSRYKPGQGPSVFSPQGGLRTSLIGLLRLAQSMPDGPQDRLWSPDLGTTLGAPGVFGSYGLGVQFLDRPDGYPRPLIGHFGNAYGFNGGCWYDRQADLAFAYALNGLPVGDEDDALSPQERAILTTVAGLA